GIEEGGADLSTGPEVPVGSFAVDPEAFCQPIGAARADATVAFTASACRHCVLDETISAPGGAGHEHHLCDGIRALALLLSQGNNGRTVIASIAARAGTDCPSLAQLICHVQFEGPRLESLHLDPLIALGRQAQAVRHR